MKIESVCYGISYISYIVDYAFRPSKFVILKAYTKGCINRVVIFKNQAELTPIFNTTHKSFKDKPYRSWREFKLEGLNWS